MDFRILSPLSLVDTVGLNFVRVGILVKRGDTILEWDVI